MLIYDVMFRNMNVFFLIFNIEKIRKIYTV